MSLNCSCSPYWSGLAVAAALLISTAALATPAPDVPDAAFVLSVDDRAPGKRHMLAGDFERARAEAGKSLRIATSLSALHTLCAANIALRDFEKAGEACDDAVAEAERLISTTANPYGQRNRDGLAKAYSNRAVLHALTSNDAAALADLQQAKRQQRIKATIDHNLAVTTARTALAGKF